MKINILTVLLSINILSLNTIYCQTNDALDEKNGFKEFQLGDAFSKWESELRNFNSDNDLEYYEYIGSCCQKVFAYDLETIRFGFLNDELRVIYLITEKFQESNTNWNGTGDFDKLKSNFSILYGEPASYDIPKEGNIRFTWAGKNVFLTLEYDYLGVMNGDRCKILVGRIDTSSLESGF